MATFCSKPSRLLRVMKPGNKNAKPTNSSTKITNTIVCCVRGIFLMVISPKSRFSGP